MSTQEAPPAVPEPIRAGLADGYDVLRPLGQGGMGVVYLARERALDRLVAVKVMRSDLVGETRSVERFLQEARLAARLRHPNIVSIHAVGSREGIHYFTMDYLEGSTLDRYVRARAGGGLAPAEARPILVAIARAVGHAHQQGIVHRDLKPGNVMIDQSGHVFVMDFGLAKPRGSGALTTVGAIVGTPQYMSPEQIDGHSASPRSDVYALGLVHFFLLTGDNLVHGESMSSMVTQHLSGSFRARVESDGRVPAAERPIILTMLERDPERRPASMEDVIRALDQAGAPVRSPLAQGAPSEPRPEVAPASPAASPPSPARRQARERIQALLKKLEEK
jgi:serine/threonine protein kinase